MQNIIQDKLETMSQIADNLVDNASLREYCYPEERLLAAKIRLIINQQRIIPIPLFSEKLDSEYTLS